ARTAAGRPSVGSAIWCPQRYLRSGAIVGDLLAQHVLRLIRGADQQAGGPCHVRTGAGRGIVRPFIGAGLRASHPRRVADLAAGSGCRGRRIRGGSRGHARPPDKPDDAVCIVRCLEGLGVNEEARIMTLNKVCVAATVCISALCSSALAQQDVLPDIPKGTIAVHLDPIATGMAAPLYGISPPGDTERLFVLEQNGLVRLIQNGTLVPTPALDIQSRVQPPLNAGNANDERGLLGITFHPGFNNPASPGYRTLYTYHSELIPEGSVVTYPAPNNAPQNYKNVVAEWKMSAGNPNIIDPASRRELISFGKNAGNHNGGTVAFGPDGYLYLAPGDGGNANDVGPSHIEPGGNAQNLSTPLGKMLRIDPVLPSLTPGSTDPASSNGQYRIPTDNPFQGAGQVPEIYAYGFRNPYRFAFDRVDLGGNGDLILADVGQRTIEEIDRVVLGGNYGWAVKEGDFLFNRADGTVGERSPGIPDGLIDPISGPLGTLEYDHGDGISITGGFVYRGTAIPELYGKYVFGDLALRNLPPRVDGRLFYADLENGTIHEFLLPQFAEGILPDGLTVHGFGEDAFGELYAMVTNTPANGTGGIVYKFVPEPTSGLIALAGLGCLLQVRAARRRNA
ncbi:MAG: PQQ-dependent sugar dehydrogenase, partial [Planctomycetes bacterium]|nr:PQQ-dependent sugar dehydrogenase [Planctomycetota bacterium]